jgi:AcrR family transcriptional regulator
LAVVSPRLYRSQHRQAVAAETRRKILEAARLLLSAEGPVSFTVEAVAAAAGVARMTVYNQFGSKPELVEALSDELAGRGGIQRLPEAFRAPDALAGLEILVEVFTRLWESERLLIRRLRAVSALDPELSRSNRDARRRQAISVLLRRLAGERGRPGPEEVDMAADLLLALTSFDTYETLAAGGREPEAVAALITASVRRLLGLES